MNSSSNSFTSSTLLRRLKEPGDSDMRNEAWKDFVDRYGPKIERWTRSSLRQDCDRRDIVQEVLVALLEVVLECEYDPPRPFRNWLRGVTRNKTCNKLRSFYKPDQASGGSSIDQFDQVVEELTEMLHDPLLLDICETRVQPMVNETHWIAYSLWKNGAKYAEITQGTGLEYSAATQAVSRIKKKLRDEMKQVSGSEQE